jgi:hypothetical protein
MEAGRDLLGLSRPNGVQVRLKLDVEIEDECRHLSEPLLEAHQPAATKTRFDALERAMSECPCIRRIAMALATLSSREFNQDASKANRAARRGPVLMGDRGQPARLLLTIEESQPITSKGGSILDWLARSEMARNDFLPPKLTGKRHREADLC